MDETPYIHHLHVRSMSGVECPVISNSSKFGSKMKQNAGNADTQPLYNNKKERAHVHTHTHVRYLHVFPLDLPSVAGGCERPCC